MPPWRARTTRHSPIRPSRTASRRTTDIVERTVGAEYAADVRAIEVADALRHLGVELTVRAPFPLVGLLGVPRMLEVTAHAPLESLD